MFCSLRNFNWETSNFQANIMKLVWWCCASARPILPSSVAVYNHAHWSHISARFFWIVHFHKGQYITEIIIMTKICIIQTMLTKQHLNGRHHYSSMVWVNEILCVLVSFKRSYNSNKTFLKSIESKLRTYGLNHMSAWLKLNPIPVVPILIMNLSHWGGLMHHGTRSYLCMALFCEISC